MSAKIRVLVVGCGHMGASHARAYHGLADDFEIVGLVARGEASRQKLNSEFNHRYAEFTEFSDALAKTRPDAVCISTYTETHAPYAVAALEAGAHVFLEKPVAENIADCERVIAAARRGNRKVIVMTQLRESANSGAVQPPPSLRISSQNPGKLTSTTSG